MTLRFRTILAVSAVILVLVTVLFFVTRHFVDDGYIAIDVKASETNTQRVLQAINRELSSLEETALDYARWDDTYRFVGEQDPGYLESSLGVNMFANYNLDSVVIYDAGGRVIHQATYNAQTGAVIEGAQSLVAYITNVQTGSNGQFITQHIDANDGTTGMILLAEGAMMIATQPILPSSGDGVITGTIVMGRYLDTLELQRLSEQIRLPLSIELLDNTTLSSDFEQANQAMDEGVSLPAFTSQQVVAGYALLTDIFGARVAILRVDTPRDAYTQSIATQRMLTIAFGAGGVSSILVIIVVIYLTVGRRLGSLNRSIRSLRQKDNFSLRILARGKDEFGLLVGEINNLLSALDQASQELSESKHFRLKLELAQNIRQLTRAIIPTLNAEQIIHTLVTELGDKFDYYYVGVFLLDEARLYAVLRAGTGNVVPAGYRLTIGGSSTVGMAISRGQIQKAEIGTRKEQTSFTRLPLARSEVAIPIRFEREILGAIAIQSTQPNSFERADEQEMLQYIADYVGVVLSTTHLIEELRGNYHDLERRYQGFLRERWVEELRLQQKSSYTFEQTDDGPAKSALNSLEKPIMLHGVQIGKVEINAERSKWTAEDNALMDALLGQTSQALENARVLERSRRRAAQERLVAKIIRSVRSSTNVDTILSTSILELGRLLRAAKAEIRIRPSANAILLERMDGGDVLTDEIAERENTSDKLASGPAKATENVNGPVPDRQADTGNSQEVSA